MNDRNRGMKVGISMALVLILVPLLVLLIWCFANRWVYPELMPENVSLRGAIEVLLGYKDMPQIMGSSLLLSLTAAALCVIISTLAARAFVFYEFAGKKCFELLAMFPVIFPATVFGMGIHMLFIRWNLNNTMTGVILTHVIIALPYGVKIMTDITAMYGKGLEEQAQVLGAGAWRSFWLVSFPKLLPGISSALSMTFILSFSQYFLTLLIGGGKIKTFSVVMVPFIQSGDKTIAANYSVVFIIAAFAVFLIFDQLGKKLAQINE